MIPACLPLWLQTPPQVLSVQGTPQCSAATHTHQAVLMSPCLYFLFQLLESLPCSLSSSLHSPLPSLLWGLSGEPVLFFKDQVKHHTSFGVNSIYTPTSHLHIHTSPPLTGLLLHWTSSSLKILILHYRAQHDAGTKYRLNNCILIEWFPKSMK